MRLGTLIAVAVAVLLAVGCTSGEDPRVTVDRHKKLAGELRDNKLYEAAVEEYEELLEANVLDDEERANICYLIGKTYYEDLSNYQEAAAWYVKARALDPNGSFMDELSRSLVASLQKLGRTVDASRQMAAVTDIDDSPPQSGDVIVARIGGDPVWRSEVEDQIQSLPLQLQKQFASTEARVEYLHQYVAMEILYRAAQREQYDQNPEVERQLELYRKKLLVDEYVVDKVMPQVKIDTADVRNFYLARKDDAYNGQPYDSVKARVFLDYQGEKTESAFMNYVSQLAEAENVEFFDQRMK